MSAKLELLERIYQDFEGSYTLHDAKEKARLFYKNVLQDVERSELEDIWVQISKEWDLNVWDADVLGDGVHQGVQMTLYPVVKGARGHSRTDTNFPYGLTMSS